MTLLPYCSNNDTRKINLRGKKEIMGFLEQVIYRSKIGIRVTSLKIIRHFIMQHHNLCSTPSTAVAVHTFRFVCFTFFNYYLAISLIVKL